MRKDLFIGCINKPDQKCRVVLSDKVGMLLIRRESGKNSDRKKRVKSKQVNMDLRREKLDQG